MIRLEKILATHVAKGLIHRIMNNLYIRIKKDKLKNGKQT